MNCFDLCGESDEQIISSYTFFLPVDTLINNSTASRRRKELRGKPPRPQNSWILYRRDQTARYKESFDGEKPSNISKDIAKAWNNESDETKKVFDALSRISKKKHNYDNKEYKYTPVTKKKRALSNETNQFNNQCQSSPSLLTMENELNNFGATLLNDTMRKMTEISSNKVDGFRNEVAGIALNQEVEFKNNLEEITNSLKEIQSQTTSNGLELAKLSIQFKRIKRFLKRRV